jgi:chemotaxis protein CheD
MPGELYTPEMPTIVTTVLGSCVAITMFGKRLGLGSICHAMLPKNPLSNEKDAFRYVDSSIRYMIEDLETAGVRKDEIEVKIMGGADVLERIDYSPASVGQQNIKEAMDIIRQEGLNLTACDVGGETGRKVVFYAHTGRVLLKKIAKRPPMSAGVRSFARKCLLHAQGTEGWRAFE